MTNSQIINGVIQVSITAFVNLLGEGDKFSRILSQVANIEDTMTDAAGKEKRAVFFDNCKIIFDDLVVPISESILRLLLELAVLYVKSRIHI